MCGRAPGGDRGQALGGDRWLVSRAGGGGLQPYGGTAARPHDGLLRAQRGARARRDSSPVDSFRPAGRPPSPPAPAARRLALHQAKRGCAISRSCIGPRTARRGSAGLRSAGPHGEVSPRHSAREHGQRADQAAAPRRGFEPRTRPRLGISLLRIECPVSRPDTACTCTSCAAGVRPRTQRPKRQAARWVRRSVDQRRAPPARTSLRPGRRLCGARSCPTVGIRQLAMGPARWGQNGTHVRDRASGTPVARWGCSEGGIRTCRCRSGCLDQGGTHVISFGGHHPKQGHAKLHPGFWVVAPVRNLRALGVVLAR